MVIKNDLKSSDENTECDLLAIKQMEKSAGNRKILTAPRRCRIIRGSLGISRVILYPDFFKKVSFSPFMIITNHFLRYNP